MFYANTGTCTDTNTRSSYSINTDTSWYGGNTSNWNLLPLPETPLPKNWRWFHAFREAPPQPLLRLLDGIREAVRTVQERHPAAQRMRWKRRRFVHQLRAAL